MCNHPIWLALALLAAGGHALVHAAAIKSPPGSYQVTWVGNSLPGASNKWGQNFFIHTKVQPDGTVNTWSHWDEGGYAITGGWKECVRVWDNRLSDGAAVGVFDPGPSVGSVENTGWIDLRIGINAFQRSTGEYMVFVEENFKAKCLIYRWRP